MHIVIKDGFLYQLGHITPYCSIQCPSHLSTLQLSQPFNAIVPLLTNCSILILTSIVQFVLFVAHLSDSITFMRCFTSWLELKYFTLYLNSCACVC